MTPIPISTPTAVRHHALFVPTGQVVGTVLFLPGTGGTADWVSQDTHFPDVATAAGLVVAIPQGLPPQPAKPAKFLTNPPRWNDSGPSDPTPIVSRNDDVTYLKLVIHDLIERRLCPTGQVCVTGFSNGASMTYRLASELAELITAIAPVAGHCWSETAPIRPVPTHAIFGALDPLVPVNGGGVRLPWGGIAIRPTIRATFANWVQLNGGTLIPSVTESAVETIYDYPAPVPITRHDLRNQGHHWPGGQGRLGPALGGLNESPYDATQAITQFFVEQIGASD